MEIPKEDEILDEIEGDIPEEYRSRLESSANMFASGLAATAAYFEGGGFRHPKRAFRIGWLVGINTRIIDDILDGENIEKIENREKFLNNYIKSINGEEVEPVENNSERAAYTVGEMMGDKFDQEIMSSYVKDVRDILIEEDKSTREGYESYSRGVSGTIGEIVGMSLDELEDFEANTENLAFAYDFAYLGQVADDMMDADTGLGDDIKIYYSEAVDRMKQHGLKGKIIGNLADIYPHFYDTMKKTASLSSFGDEKSV